MPIYNRDGTFNIVAFLTSSKRTREQTKLAQLLNTNEKYITTKNIEKLINLPKEIINKHEFKNPDAELIFNNIVKCFSGNIFEILFEHSNNPIFIKEYFRIILDNKWENILKLVNSIPIISYDPIFDSLNLIKNIMVIISFQLQDENENYIQYHRAPFTTGAEILPNFMFFLAMGFIFKSKFILNVELCDSIDKSTYIKKIIDNDNSIDENELKILLKFENYFKIVNKYFKIKMKRGFIFENAVRCIEGPNFTGRIMGSGATKECKRRDEILLDISKLEIVPRPPRYPKRKIDTDTLNDISPAKKNHKNCDDDYYCDYDTSEDFTPKRNDGIFSNNNSNNCENEVSSILLSLITQKPK